MEEGIKDQELTQSTYSGTPYVDTSWEVVGESHETEDFTPMEFEVLELGERVTVDPMFADYGGIAQSDEKIRKHIAPGKTGRVSSNKPEQEVELATIELTEEELEKLKQEAFARGEAAGFEKSEADQKEKIAIYGQKLEIFCHVLKERIDNEISRQEQQALNLSLAVANKIMGTTVELKPDYIVEIISQALSHVGTAQIRRIKISAEDQEFIEVFGVKNYFKDIVGDWEFEVDPEITSGCLIETSAGDIDMQLDKAWERIRDKVLVASGDNE